jgi:hypothetical protein
VGIVLLPVLLEVLGEFFCFLFLWKHLLGDNFLGGRLPSFCLPFFLFFLLIVIWCIALLLHRSASVLFGFFILPFPFHGYAINRGGVLVCRALSTLVLTLLLYPSLSRS